MFSTHPKANFNLFITFVFLYAVILKLRISWYGLKYSNDQENQFILSVSCNKLTSPTNGAVTLTSDGSTTVANFSCSLGYTMTGSSLLTCKADGSWDFTSPACGKAWRLTLYQVEKF